MIFNYKSQKRSPVLNKVNKKGLIKKKKKFKKN